MEEGSKAHRARTVGTGRAHAKAILLGEHAVVYGTPALAMPVPQLAVTASAGWSSHSAGSRGDPTFTMTGPASRGAVTAQASDGLRRLTAAFEAHTGATGGHHLDVSLDGAIPPGRGLGSSAANARAIVLALADLFGRKLTEREVFDLVQAAENLTHGRASGVDAMTVGAAAPLLFQSGEAQALDIGCDALVVVADSGTAGSTKEAVELLRAGFRAGTGKEERFMRRAAQLVDDARASLAEGEPEEFGSCLTGYHDLLRGAGLSTDRIDALVEAALQADSLGAKITGGGLGGCVLAVSRPERAGEVARQLHAAGAVRTWAVPLRRSTHEL
ncbi:mevalonate kinase [Kitasatospora sp. CB02891]|uniref:mevalonate kinase n=1 Tax=Kitasatospora sp. CB02891 TaxID=2020329 RepID=UPI001E4D8201|nr:mevalonate kinase [Kitasatospora sp. CB02891]